MSRLPQEIVLKKLIVPLIGIALTSLSNGALAEHKFAWDFVVLDKKTNAPIPNIPVECTFTDVVDYGKTSQGTCTTDEAGKCQQISISVGSNSFFSPSNVQPDCSPKALAYSKEMRVSSRRKEGGGVETTFWLTAGAGDIFELDYYLREIKVVDDDLEVTARITTPKVTDSRSRYSAYIRAFVDKKTNAASYQLVTTFDYHEQKARRYELATGGSASGPVILNIRKISYDVSCDGPNKVNGLCRHWESVGVDIPEAIVKETAAAFSPGSVASIWKMRITSLSDNRETLEIPHAAFAALLAKVEQYRARGAKAN